MKMAVKQQTKSYVPLSTHLAKVFKLAVVIEASYITIRQRMKAGWIIIQVIHLGASELGVNMAGSKCTGKPPAPIRYRTVESLKLTVPIV
jgi:hypothetical protein